MANLSLHELKLIAKTRGIKGYGRMSEDRLLSALNASKSVKTITEFKKANLSLNELKLIAKIKGIKGYEKILSALNESEPLKTIKETRKENLDEDKIFSDLNILFQTRKRSF